MDVLLSSFKDVDVVFIVFFLVEYVLIFLKESSGLVGVVFFHIIVKHLVKHDSVVAVYLLSIQGFLALNAYLLQSVFVPVTIPFAASHFLGVLVIFGDLSQTDLLGLQVLMVEDVYKHCV